MTPEGLRSAAAAIGSARRLLVSTGAGMSKDSGIPTFRESGQGLWARFKPEELATEQAFRRAPERVWRWYAERRAAMRQCSPHPGHRALVEMEALVPEMVVVTQNIDGLHQRSGSGDVVELHGSIDRIRCLECSAAPSAAPDPEAGLDRPPACAECGAYLRPDVVWFGEMLPAAAVERAWQLAADCDVLLVVGTSGVVWPAAELPLVASRAGARVIEVSPETTELTRVADVFLEGPAAEVLPALVGAMRAHP